ncbi:MAG: reverse transcriptase domain-containing protein [Caulobacterales bacterium]
MQPEISPDDDAIAPAAAILVDGRAPQTTADIAALFGVSPGRLTYALYRADPSERYRQFEIPKRSGGMREINAPIGLVRDFQEALAPLLLAAYRAHPGAHGFIPARSILTNAKAHAGQRLVFNVDLKDFFPTINFGRVRGLFMAAPFHMGAPAATVLAQVCTLNNGLPQGAPTSPVLSNFIATALDRRLTRLARDNGVRYSRYADDITFSTSQNAFPVGIVAFEQNAEKRTPIVGDALGKAIAESGFQVNFGKVRLQTRHERQSVTGLVVNAAPNIERARIRRVRAMLHAWAKFGLEAAGAEHFRRWRRARPKGEGQSLGAAFRNVVYGELAFIKMIRSQEDPVFLKLCARVLELDPNPSKFIRQMAFGADDFDVFISHASEDKDAIARPIFEACQKLGLKAFLDEAHIGWGASFTEKINVALGSARTVLVIVSSASVAKDWPVREVNAALALEVAGEKTVVPLIVGKPDLARLPLIKTKDQLVWTGDPMFVAKNLAAAVKGKVGVKQRRAPDGSLKPAPAAPATAWPFPAATPPSPGWRGVAQTGASKSGGNLAIRRANRGAGGLLQLALWAAIAAGLGYAAWRLGVW